MTSQAEKGAAFAALHEGPDIFVIPNPWDAGSARMLAAKGFKALATTSAGMAMAAGRRDATVAREDVLGHCRALCAAVDLPVSADLENCFADTPEGVAETVKLAAATGLAGCSIEDADRTREQPVYDLGEARERVAAAVAAARALPFPFLVTARAENYLFGRPDVADTIARLQAYQEAGADVLFAPGPGLDEMARIVRAVDRPVNAVMGIGALRATVAELAGIGVRRVSIGASLFRAAFTGAVQAADEIATHGTFGFLDGAMKSGDILPLLEG